MSAGPIGGDVFLSVVTAARQSLRPIDLMFRGAPDQLIVLMLQADRERLPQ